MPPAKPSSSLAPRSPFKCGIIVLCGRPNAGKSTLLNRVVGSSLSIVTRRPQTTRERVQGILNTDQGQVVFVDTPGVHFAKPDGLNATMMKEVTRALESPEVIWYLVDPQSTLKRELPVIELVARAKSPVFLLMNKAESFHNATLQAEILKEFELNHVKLVDVKEISARTGLGVDDLLAKSWGLLPEGQALYPNLDDLSDKPMRFFAGEKIREQLFLLLGEELPYSCAVEVKEFRESTSPIYISAEIYVERDSQKGMVVGAGGKKIKEIGQAARVKVEKLVGGKVFLDLRVSVLHNWSRDPKALERLGYQLPDSR